MILTPAIRAELIALAKSRAEPVANCVTASIPPAHLLSDLPREALTALVIVLAEAADRQRLHAIVTAADDGALVAEPAPVPLRDLHTEYERYRRAGIAIDDIPVRVRKGETDYQRESKRRLRAVA